MAFKFYMVDDWDGPSLDGSQSAHNLRCSDSALSRTSTRPPYLTQVARFLAVNAVFRKNCFCMLLQLEPGCCQLRGGHGIPDHSREDCSEKSG